MDFIKIDNSINSGDFEGVELLSYKLPSLIAPFQKATEASEKLLLSQSKGKYREQSLSIEIAVIGDSLPQCYKRTLNLTSRLKTAQCIEISELDGLFFRGYMSEINTLEQEETWLRLDLKFTLNPPCACKLIGSAGTMLLPRIAPLAEQITENNASYNAKVTKTEKLQLFKDSSDPEIYLMLIGSWDSLKIGGLELPKVSEQIVYIDAEAEQAYLKLDSKRTNLADIKGDFKLLNYQNELIFSGENMNFTAHVYAVERL